MSVFVKITSKIYKIKALLLNLYTKGYVLSINLILKTLLILFIGDINQNNIVSVLKCVFNIKHKKINV